MRLEPEAGCGMSMYQSKGGRACDHTPDRPTRHVPLNNCPAGNSRADSKDPMP